MNGVVEQQKKMLDYQESIGNMIKASSTGETDDVRHWYDYWTGQTGSVDRYFFNDDVTQNLSQVLDAYKEMRVVIESL